MNNLPITLLTSGLSIGSVLLIIYFFPQKFNQWMAIADRLFYKLSKIYPLLRNIFDKRAVASSIKDVVNTICQQINEEAPDTIPHPLQIQWIKSGKEGHSMREGEVILRLKQFENQDRNVVTATLMYLNAGFLPKSKNYMDHYLYKSCELKVASDIFISDRNSGAYDYFYQNIFEPLIKSSQLIEKNLQLINDIDSVGFFTHIFLSEIKETGNKLLGTIKTSEVENELRNFASFLQTIANKDDYEDVPLKFRGKHIKVGIVLVARRDTIETYGTDPYITAIIKNIKDGYDSIYINAWGKQFVKKVIQIKEESKKKIITILRIYRYVVRNSVEGILIVCQPNYSFIAKQTEINAQVVKTCEEAIPLIKNGAVVINSIAIIKNIGLKIAVRWKSKNKRRHYDAVGYCIGKNSEYLRILNSKFPREFIHLIAWSENRKEFIINSLFPLKENQVNGIELDEFNYTSNVYIGSEEALKTALGLYNNNVKIASELVGLDINIVRPEYFKNHDSPEQELQSLLLDNIPLIKNGDVSIINIARIKGIGSRVIFKKNIYNPAMRQQASQACKGPGNEYYQSLKSLLKDEWLYFHEYSQEISKQILYCLYPLKQKDVLSIDLDEESKTAVLTTIEHGSSPPFWNDIYKILLSEKITGWSIELK